MGNREVDQEWVELIKQALEAGISKEKIREFLQKQPQNVNSKFNVI